MFLLVSGGIVWLTRCRVQESIKRPRACSEWEVAHAQTIAEELRLLLQAAAGYTIFLLDSVGNIVSWDSAARRIFDWRKADILGRHYCILYPADADARHHSNENLRKAERYSCFSEEAWQVRRDDSEFLAAVTVNPLRTEEGQLRGYATVIHDITEMRAAEIALEKTRSG